MNEKGLPNYPELNRIALLYPNPQILLGDEIYWTEKRDGSQLRIGMVDGEIKIATHHQDDASTQFKGYFKMTEQAIAIEQLLKDTNGFCDNPVADFNFGAVIFGELLSKGKSPARFEHHDKFEFVIFDIWSTKDERFLTYNNVYQHAYHYSLPVVECWAITRHTDLDSLYATRDEMLALAKEKKREGVVLKNYHSQIFAKEKLDTPTIQIIKIDDGAVHLPRLPDSEVLGAIAKVHVDLGESFMDKKIAMPTIAKYVSEEQDKHLCSKPSQNLFSFYQKYIEGLVK
jgi:ATP-dependent RNA circularization protein (DNA/RNA ligase family)